MSGPSVLGLISPMYVVIVIINMLILQHILVFEADLQTISSAFPPNKRIALPCSP